jgi:LemA protein
MRKLFFIIMISAVTVINVGCGYNTMLSNEEAVKAQWGDVQAQYQRRMDLIPNLVNVVKGYAAFEKETLTAVIEARSKASSIQVTPELLKDKDAFNKFQQAQGGISSALSRLMVVVEKYPDLKANQNFMDLQSQLEGTENRINVARMRYNEAVRVFNTSIRIFPNSCTNSMFLHLETKDSFKAAEGAEKAPEVKM